MTNPRDRYVTGRIGSYDAATVASIDRHLRGLRYRLTLADQTERQRARVREDIDALLDRRTRITRVDAGHGCSV